MERITRVRRCLLGRLEAPLLGLGLCGCVHYEPKPIVLKQTANVLESRSLTNDSLRLYLASNLGREFPEWPPKVWDFEQLSWVAFYYHPTLEIARAQWAVARGGQQSASARPNPTLGLTPGYNFNAANGVSPWFPGATLDWPIETAGKRAKRVSRAAYLSESARLNVASAAWQVRSALRLAMIDIVAAEKRGALIQQQMEAQQQVVALLEQRLAAGGAAALELSGPRLALARLQSDLLEVRRARVEARSRLADALGTTAPAVLHLPILYPIEARASLPFALEQARAMALQQRADLLAALATYESAQANLQVEIARQYPDLHLGTGYQWDQGENKWNLAMTVELPLLSRNQGPIAEAEARRRESAAQLIALQLRVIAEIDRAATLWRTSAEQLTGIRRVNGALRERMRLSAARLEVGAGDQLELQLVKSDLGAGDLLQLEGEIRLAKDAGQLEDALQVPFVGSAGLEHGSGFGVKAN